MKYKMLTAGKDAPACRRNMHTLVRSTRTGQRIKKTVAVAAAQTPSFIPEIPIIIMNPSPFVNRQRMGKFRKNAKSYRLRLCQAGAKLHTLHKNLRRAVETPRAPRSSKKRSIELM